MDNQIFYFFYNLAHSSVFADKIIVFFANQFIFIVILAAFLLVAFHQRIFPSQNPIKELQNKWKVSIPLVVSGGFAWVLAKVLKILIHTPRPFEALSNVQPLFLETGYAFPSGHTLVASAVAFTVFLAHKKAGLPPQAGYVFIVFALVIGFARVAAGVHFPIDILGGFILGFLVSYLFAYFVKNV